MKFCCIVSTCESTAGVQEHECTIGKSQGQEEECNTHNVNESLNDESEICELCDHFFFYILKTGLDSNMYIFLAFTFVWPYITGINL